jgi:type II secretory pathway pseudopilin PulG
VEGWKDGRHSSNLQIFHSSASSAFTLLEIMLVLTLFMISLGFVALYSQTAQVRADVNGQASVLAGDLRLAQSQASSGEDDQAHGIHLETAQYTVFAGSTYDDQDPLNRTVAFSGAVEIQNIKLNGDGVDVIFTPPHGETETYGALDVVSTQTDQSVTLTISSLGTISY